MIGAGASGSDHAHRLRNEKALESRARKVEKRLR
jgi:hypothetical protein